MGLQRATTLIAQPCLEVTLTLGSAQKHSHVHVSGQCQQRTTYNAILIIGDFPFLFAHFIILFVVTIAGYWGSYYPAESCATGSFVTAFKTKLDVNGALDGDFRGLTAVMFRCSPTNKNILSKDLSFGNWVPASGYHQQCPGGYQAIRGKTQESLNELKKNSVAYKVQPRLLTKE